MQSYVPVRIRNDRGIKPKKTRREERERNRLQYYLLRLSVLIVAQETLGKQVSDTAHNPKWAANQKISETGQKKTFISEKQPSIKNGF